MRYLRHDTRTSSIIVSVYVDDMTIFACTDEELTRLKGALSSKFNVTDLGELRSILDMEIARNDARSISLNLLMPNGPLYPS